MEKITSQITALLPTSPFRRAAVLALGGSVLLLSIRTVRRAIFAYYLNRHSHSHSHDHKKKGDGHGNFPGVLERRQQLVSPVRGKVLEIGPGTGANFQYFPKDGSVEWWGIEPNEHMHGYLKQQLVEAGFNEKLVHFTQGTAEEQMLSLASDSFDVVLSTMVLCSVKDVPAVLQSAKRVLKPGGKFIFIDHVAAPTGSTRRFFQGLVQPLIGLLVGSSIIRDIGSMVKRAGFSRVDIENWTTGSQRSLVADFVSGIAYK